jgi:hypothetical protein
MIYIFHLQISYYRSVEKVFFNRKTLCEKIGVLCLKIAKDKKVETNYLPFFTTAVFCSPFLFVGGVSETLLLCELTDSESSEELDPELLERRVQYIINKP